MKADELYLTLCKRPQAVCKALNAFGINKPNPTLNDVVNAYVVHEAAFADELSKELGYSSFDGSSVLDSIDSIAKALTGISILASKSKATKTSTQTEPQPEAEIKIFGINQTLFVMLLVVFVLIALAAIF